MVTEWFVLGLKCGHRQASTKKNVLLGAHRGRIESTTDEEKNSVDPHTQQSKRECDYPKLCGCFLIPVHIKSVVPLSIIKSLLFFICILGVSGVVCSCLDFSCAQKKLVRHVIS